MALSKRRMGALRLVDSVEIVEQRDRARPEKEREKQRADNAEVTIQQRQILHIVPILIPFTIFPTICIVENRIIRALS